MGVIKVGVKNSILTFENVHVKFFFKFFFILCHLFNFVTKNAKCIFFVICFAISRKKGNENFEVKK